MKNVEIKIIGPCMSGKTFLLGEIAEFLAERGYDPECYDDNGMSVKIDRQSKIPANLFEARKITLSTSLE